MEIVNKVDGSTLEIYLEDLGGEGKKKDVVISMLQTCKGDGVTVRDAICLTPDMIDAVCDELQELKKLFERG